MTRLKLAIVLLIGVAIPMTSFWQDSLGSKLISKTALSLAAARDIASAAEAEARKNNWNVSIAIVDESGRLLYFQRMDDTTNASVDIAIAKAQHAANYRRDTKFHEDALDNGKNVVLALPDGMPLEGGLRLIANDKIIGGIGVSGVRSTEDAQIARAGAGLLTR